MKLIVDNTKPDDPGVGQGREERHHHPKVNREALIGLALVVLPWPILTGLVFLVLWVIKELV